MYYDRNRTDGPKPSVGGGCGAILLTLLAIGLVAGFSTEFTRSIDEKRHPGKVVARKAAEAKAGQETAAQAAREAAEKERFDDAIFQSEILRGRSEQAKAAIGLTLRDPRSAVYRNVMAMSGGTSFCGEVNTTNGFGGYAGFRTFIVVGTIVTYSPTEDGPFVALFEQKFDQWCRRPPKKEVAYGF